jgi:hypothetical protein
MQNTNIDKIRSEFLRKCIEIFDKHHDAQSHYSTKPLIEELHTFVPIYQKFGMPSNNTNSDKWQFIDSASAYEDGLYNICFYTNSRHELIVRDGTEDDCYLKLELSGPDEITEIIQLLETLDDKNCKINQFKPTPIRSILEGIYVLVPCKSEHFLIPLSWKELEQKNLNFLLPLKAHFRDIGELADINFSSWEEWVLSEGGFNEGQFPEKLRGDDLLLFSLSEGLYSARPNINREDNYCKLLPKLVFRLRDNQSKMYFLDYLRYTTEGQSVLKQVIANFENLDQHLETTKLNYPSDKLTQIRLSAEFRSTKYTDHKNLVVQCELLKSD